MSKVGLNVKNGLQLAAECKTGDTVVDDRYCTYVGVTRHSSLSIKTTIYHVIARDIRRYMFRALGGYLQIIELHKFKFNGKFVLCTFRLRLFIFGSKKSIKTNNIRVHRITFNTFYWFLTRTVDLVYIKVF